MSWGWTEKTDRNEEFALEDSCTSQLRIELVQHVLRGLDLFEFAAKDARTKHA